MSKRILITGRSGFVGGHAADRFQQLGWQVIGAGRRPLQCDSYVSMDIATGIDKAHRLLRDDFDVVVHAAAHSSPWGSSADFHANNIEATENVIKFCRSSGSPKLILISSASVFYRPCDQLNIRETDPIPRRFVNEYARTKYASELLLREYEGKSVILRPRAIYGPGDPAILPRIIRAARLGKFPLIEHRGKSARCDLVYIANLIDIIEKAASTEVVGDFNVTDGQPIEINSFVEAVLRDLKLPIPKRKVSATKVMCAAIFLEWWHRIFCPNQEPAITRFAVHVLRYSKTFDISKSIAAFRPARVSLDEGRQSTVEWFRDRI